MIRQAIVIIAMMMGSVIGSPIIDYQEAPEKMSKESFYILYLKHASVTSITPLLKGVCRECDWVTDQSLQRIGVSVSSDRWPDIKKAIQNLDRQEPMIQLVIDVVEISDVESEKYQHMLYQLSEPFVLNSDAALSMDIEYMISSGNAMIVSSPRMITKSGQKATISVGDRVPYTTIIQNASSTIKTVEYIDSGIELGITAFAHYNDSLDLQINLSYKTVSGYRIDEQSEMPIIASRKTELNVQVPSNSTVVFAGLLDQSTHESIEKVPFLGDIPIIGHLFTKTKHKQRATDLIYKITPTIL